MNLLLDTHVALWAIADSPKLSGGVRMMIESPTAVVWVSAASIWEISIKHGLGRGGMPLSGQEALRFFTESGYRFLPIEPEHAAAVEDLPGHHADPFDRILVAQALVEPMRLITHDPVVARYSDTIIKI
ncbi:MULTISPECIES: type II toxin-antitoxin system VapC family toxin [Ramlibacter]|uniref:Type II toxin-antitoxin system VapC family toxin n=1 Tax=Ramlibacter aquaticus TaxID=2780094 RepID=A0ABR9SJ17_9BURK|nr:MULTISPECIES: type II toxin-antitoxin system VapC family toxin [Ramlibacter]MBE7942361.1 type II toxin-antitoxin system VapC family toxin [Ramlibacter aquaticus]